MIRTENLTRIFRTEEVETIALNGVNIEVEDGEFIAIMGPSGCGKSTLLNILGLLDSPTEGKYWLNNEEVGHLKERERTTYRKGRIGFVFQNFNLLARTSALENVMMPAYYHHPAMPSSEIRKRALELIRMVGLEERMHHTPAQLSGGQQQRVAIARSLINNPGILLADEPTGNLDSTTSVEVMNMFRDLNRQKGITVIIVTHDRKTAAFTDRAINMCDGLIMEGVSEELSATLSK